MLTDEVEPDDELPSIFLIFTGSDLDQNEDKARAAGAEIQRILRGVIDRVGDLEYVEQALRQAEPTSVRARRAREQLLSVLSQTDDLVAGLDNAWGALTFHWNVATPVSHGTAVAQDERT
ncbi:MAG: hypothetical protein ACRDSR_09950 [Pseudonocardiaceae bacterium]